MTMTSALSSGLRKLRTLGRRSFTASAARSGPSATLHEDQGSPIYRSYGEVFVANQDPYLLLNHHLYIKHEGKKEGYACVYCENFLPNGLLPYHPEFEVCCNLRHEYDELSVWPKINEYIEAMR